LAQGRCDIDVGPRRRQRGRALAEIVFAQDPAP
jgi:hypothetical protein